MKKEPAVRVTAIGDIELGRIPPHVAENLAQSALGAIQRAYRDPAIRADYERWKAERARAATA